MIKEWYSIFKKEMTGKERQRAEVCSSCEFRVFTKYLDFIKSEIKTIQGHYCKKCGCPLVAKIRSTNKKNICSLWKD